MPKDDIIASSPIVQGDGQLLHRIVIRNLGQKFVVHTQSVSLNCEFGWDAVGGGSVRRSEINTFGGRSPPPTVRHSGV
jgi:hypothetical protein